jgi:integrase core domain protein
VDIKYVPPKCIEENPNETQYYQITAIDEYSRKRVAVIVDEKSVTHTSEFLLTLESKMGFKISTVQTDNGREFTNMGSSERICQFDVVAKWLEIGHKTTRLFLPWQNSKVERSHRRDGEGFYNRSFRTIEVLCKAHKWYISRYNNIVQRTLGFKSPNELVTEFFLAHSA